MFFGLRGSFPEIDLRGIYPNMESLGAQAVILLAAAARLWLFTQRASRIAVMARIDGDA